MFGINNCKPWSILLASLTILLFAGCHATPEKTIEQILQIPQSTPVYTQHNLWYTSPSEASALNYQTGNILPFGTEVENVEVDEDEISFTVKGTGEQFTVDYPKSWMMMPIQDYVKQLFTSKSRTGLEAELKTPGALDCANSGKVKKGMTRREVTIAFGYPCPHRTPYLKEDTWIYSHGEMDSERVVFKKDKVMTILELK